MQGANINIVRGAYFVLFFGLLSKYRHRWQSTPVSGFPNHRITLIGCQ